MNARSHRPPPTDRVQLRLEKGFALPHLCYADVAIVPAGYQSHYVDVLPVPKVFTVFKPRYIIDVGHDIRVARRGAQAKLRGGRLVVCEIEASADALAIHHIL